MVKVDGESLERRVVDLAAARPTDRPGDHQTPEALAAFHKAEIEKWWPIIKAAGIKLE
jgi:hypothetical protein